MLSKIRSSHLLSISIVLGVCCGFFSFPFLLETAQVASDIFLNLLKLISLPIIFLSIVSTASGMQSMKEIHSLGRKVAKYTMITTVIAATIALILFLAIEPVSKENLLSTGTPQHNMPSGTYKEYVLQLIPSNIIHPFLENNVIGILFLALLLSFAILTLPKEKKETLHFFFSSLYEAVMTITKWIVSLMPIAIWAFITLFITNLKGGMQIRNLALYLLCVVIANLMQAFIVLPLILKGKGISPLKAFKAMLPALSVAFFSKSSSGSLPMAMKCAEEKADVSPKVARFAFPLCTTINMNGCAAFILTTVLFVSMSNGIVFSYAEMVLWVFVATIAAIGNAGVPMGCYFLSGALLAAMNVPLHLLGVILPFYTMIDMLESAINVWSDSCVAIVVDKEIKQEEKILSAKESSNPAPISF